MGSRFYVGDRVYSFEDDEYGVVIEELDNGEDGVILRLDNEDVVERFDHTLVDEDQHDYWS